MSGERKLLIVGGDFDRVMMDEIRSKLGAIGHRDAPILVPRRSIFDVDMSNAVSSDDMEWEPSIRALTPDEIKEACLVRGITRRTRNTKVYGASVSGSERRRRAREARST